MSQSHDQDETGHVEILTPICPWCEQPMTGPTDGGLCVGCAAELEEALNLDHDSRYIIRVQPGQDE